MASISEEGREVKVLPGRIGNDRKTTEGAEAVGYKRVKARKEWGYKSGGYKKVGATKT